MNYKAELRKANIFRESIDSLMEGIEIPGNVRSRLFNGCYHLSLEHFCSVIHLLNLNFYASAAALIRPQYEATVRGMYFQDFATDKAVKNFLSGDSNPTLATLVGNITTELESSKESAFYRFFKKIEGLMNDFSHGGIQQINKRYTSTDLVNNFSEKDKFVLVSTALVSAQLAVTCALAAAGKEKESTDLLLNIVSPRSS